MVEPETAGDPMSAQKWVHSSLRHLTTRLTAQGHAVSHQTVGSIAQQDLDALNLERHSICLHWNYTLRPRTQATVEAAQEREVVS
jgi:hypothetical protein